jgi:uncharacterized tellurite resistance protein B-like protein
MSQALKDLYTNVSVHATADREHQAAVELLLLVMAADHRIDGQELEAIRSISDDQGFESKTFNFEQYLPWALAKVHRALANGVADELLDDIDRRITSTVLRHSLFAAARDVAQADDELDVDEESLLVQVAARFA